MGIREVLENNKDYIIKEIKNGRSNQSLAKEFGCNSGTIWYLLKDYKIKSQYSRSKNYGKKYQYKNEVIRRFLDGQSVYSISQVINISNSTVNKWLREWGYNTSRGCTVVKNKPLLKDKWLEVLELHNLGWSQKQIADKLGYNRSQISRILSKHNIAAHPINKYTVNEDYFNIIDSEYKAYILGWLYSDGNIQFDGKIRIALREDDKEILEWIKNELRYTGPLYYKKSRNNAKGLWELCINRKILADQIIKLGCIPNKSLCLFFPPITDVPCQYVSSFVRGYFDGDGSIAINYINITSSLKFINGLKIVLADICKITNVYQRYKDKQPKDSSHQLFICQKSECKKFVKWLYQDATIYLQRKYDIAQKYFLD